MFLQSGSLAVYIRKMKTAPVEAGAWHQEYSRILESVLVGVVLFVLFLTKFLRAENLEGNELQD